MKISLSRHLSYVIPTCSLQCCKVKCSYERERLLNSDHKNAFPSRDVHTRIHTPNVGYEDTGIEFPLKTFVKTSSCRRVWNTLQERPMRALLHAKIQRSAHASSVPRHSFSTWPQLVYRSVLC